ncbi:MAG TPA: histidinol-phosphate transaminase [Candidatus Nanopelagicaceae bacterium]|jgi:histidinol-phosphate aminotransferase
MSQQEWPNWLPLRADLRGLSPYGAPQLPSLAQLNTNENPYPPSKELMEAIARRVGEVAGSLNRYPDRDATELRKALAAFLNSQSQTTLSESNIWAANGSNEIIQSIFLAFGGEKALGFTPSYSMHPLIAKVTGTPWINGVRNPDFSLDVEDASRQIRESKSTLVFITTPNNPTGTSVPLRDIETLAKVTAESSGLLVVDEAYAEFSSEPSAVTLLEKYPNLLVIRTMSKAFAFAGARVGYLAADPHVIDALQLVRLPYHLGAVTQAIALVALEHSDQLLAKVATLVADRERMVSDLKTLGADVIPSSANFLLFSVPSSKEIWHSLLDQGVLVRDVGLSGYLRVTIGNAAENQRFIDSLATSLGKSLGGKI